MQFIEFKKEHFTHNAEKNNYFLEIPKDEVDFGNVKIQKRQDDHVLDDIDYDIIDHPTRITVILKTPEDIRVNF